MLELKLIYVKKRALTAMQGPASIEPVNIEKRKNVVFHADWRMLANAQIHDICCLQRSKSSDTTKSGHITIKSRELKV